MSHVQRIDATYTDANGQEAPGYQDITVFELPTVNPSRVGTGAVYEGDDIVIKVTGTTDPDAQPGVAGVPGGTQDPDDPTLWHVTAAAG